jgi:ATP-dependent RNA helicase DeaD
MAQGERPLLAPARPDERGARVAAPASAPVATPVSDAGDTAPAPASAPAERDRAPRRVRAGSDDAPKPGCVRYRLEVGSQHGVLPKNIVGAIANEAGLDSGHIGPITICDEFSTVDLPDGMPKDLFKHLRQVWVCGRRLKLSVLAQAGDAGAPHDSGAGQHGGRGPAAGAEPRPGKSPGKGHARSKDKGKRKDKSKRKRDRPGPATARGG